MYDRILVPLDGSPAAEAILPQVYRLLSTKDTEIILARVIEITPAYEGIDVVALHERDRAEAHRYIHDLARDMEKKGIRVRGVIRDGTAAPTLAKLAEQENAGLIALSTHGRSGISRWVFGSVTQDLVRSSKVPVLVVRPPDQGAAAPEKPHRRILVPVDGSPRSLAAVPYAEALARLFEAELVFLSVREPIPATTGAAYAAAFDARSGAAPPQEAAEIAAAEMDRTGVRARAVVLDGDAAAGILDAGRAFAVDLIVMATHGRSGLARWTLGSVTETVLRAATVPVLVVPRAAAEGHTYEGDEWAA